MTSEQRRQIQQAAIERVTKHRTLLTTCALFFTGVVDEIRAWHNHDIGDAVVVAIIFFLLGPFISIGFGKLIRPLDD